MLLASNYITVLNCPSCSPHLNAMKMCGGILKKYIKCSITLRAGVTRNY